jgi:hypothetical protein
MFSHTTSASLSTRGLVPFRFFHVSQARFQISFSVLSGSNMLANISRITLLISCYRQFFIEINFKYNCGSWLECSHVVVLRAAQQDRSINQIKQASARNGHAAWFRQLPSNGLSSTRISASSFYRIKKLGSFKCDPFGALFGGWSSIYSRRPCHENSISVQRGQAYST